MLYQADWLLNPGSPPARQGWLRAESGRIVETGSGNLPKGPSKRFAGCALLPGLVNAHCHLELTALENALEPGKTFPDWVRDLQGVTAGYTLPDYRSSARAGIERLLRGGCTAVLDVGNSGEALKALAESPLRAFACAEALGLDPAHAESRFENALSLARAAEATDRFKPGVAPHAPYSCSVALLRSLIEYQVSRKLPLSIHAAESREEEALFASASGPMQEFRKRIYPAAPEHRGTTPIRWLESEGLLPDGALIIHGNTLDEADMEILARRRATVVHCPSSHAFFGHPRFPYEKLRAHGIPVCLGTDSLASADSLSMLEQMRLFSRNHPDVTAGEILRMATEVGARALGLSGVAGRLEAGLEADFIIARPENGKHAPDDPATAVLAPGTRIERVLIAGVLA